MFMGCVVLEPLGKNVEDLRCRFLDNPHHHYLQEASECDDLSWNLKRKTVLGITRSSIAQK